MLNCWNDSCDDEVFIVQIKGMDEEALLDLVMEYPEYLTDSYYRLFRSAIKRRYKQLREQRGSE